MSRGRGLRWRFRDGARATEADDCEAFVAGSLVEFLTDRHQPVPPWAWTNLLAHGSPAALDAERSALWAPQPDPNRQPPYGKWRLARAYVADDVLALASTCGGLGVLQQEALIPLELELASRSDVGWWKADRWVQVVEATLDQYRTRVHGRADRAGRDVD